MTEAVVVLVGDEIVAYVSGGGPPHELQKHCSRFLPSHMMPNRLVPVQEWPRLNSGKIDRGALPKPSQSPRDVPQVPPREVPRVPSERTHAKTDAVGDAMATVSDVVN